MATTVDQKLLKATKFPPEFNQKVDMQKVNLEVMRKWIAGKISDILGSEDDVVIELCFNLIEGSRYPEIKKLQIQLTGFLEKDTPAFCKELWKLCLSAQNSPQGVPKELLEAKKLELIQEKVEAEKAAEEARRRREIDSQRERDMDSIRNRERDERGRGGYGMRNDNWRRGRGDRDFGRGGDNNRGGHRRSRSPGQWRAPPRDTDSYVPRGGGRRRDDNRRRSPSPALDKRPASASPSRSPPRRREQTATVAAVGEVGDKVQTAAAEDHTHHPTLGPHPQRRGNAGGRHPPPKADLLHPSLAEDAETAAVPAPVLVLATAPFHGHPSESRRTQFNATTSPRRERKRRGSIERYAPRRHHTSSISPPNTKRIKRADNEEDERRRSPYPAESPRGRTRTRSISRPHSPPKDDAEMTGTKDQEPNVDQPLSRQDPQKEASALREKLLRERIKKMRMLSISSNKAE
ncbi:hypothetical protein V495_08752 [Pseudogymnoascus sp. VKM F-4514 (FW-929)]|nr:hypothetical protein V495_08752 [Pseudogymnoascus sp. VKM F-4514 (FW-929)]KFY63280.1 hypothetical protein V497_02079 [Pseudogymnoascus sp. VKM F-4516 (FW-969)]